MKWYLVERTFQMRADHLTHPNHVMPIRSRVEATNKAEAQVGAEAACQAALESLNGVGQGKWYGEAQVLGVLEVDENVEGDSH